MKYFKEVKSLEDLKKQFKKLAMKHHPDRGGDQEIMKAINNEYDKLFPIWKAKDNIKSDETSESTRNEFYTRNGWKGENYNRNLSTKEIAKKIREQLKEEFSDCKFSVITRTYSGGSSIDVRLMEASENVLAEGIKADNITGTMISSSGSEYLNEYGNTIAQKVNEIIDSYRFDDSDSMIDYFNTNFYGFFYIGKWDKPFQVVYREKKQSKSTNTTKENSKETSNEFEIVENIEKNGIELYFKGIPDANFRQQLKENGFKWNPKKKCWYAKKTNDIMNFLNSLTSDKEDNKPETPADTIEKIINDLDLETGKDFSYYFNIIKENNIEKDSLQAEVIKYHLFKYGNPSITALVSWCDKYNLNKDLPATEIKHQVANIIYQRILNDLNDGQMVV